MDKRTFLKTAGLASLGATLNLTSLKSAVAAVEGQDPWQVAANEDLWRKVRGDYTLKPDYINLENGYYCFMPQETLEHQIQHLRRINYEGQYYMRTARQKNKRIVAAKLARIVGADPAGRVSADVLPGVQEGGKRRTMVTQRHRDGRLTGVRRGLAERSTRFRRALRAFGRGAAGMGTSEWSSDGRPEGAPALRHRRGHEGAGH